MWQEKPTAIVMLTNLEEENKVKCEQYWPKSGKENYGAIQVIVTDQTFLADYVTRMFIVTVSSIIILYY